MVLARIKYTKFLLGYLATSSGSVEAYNANAENLLRAEQGSGGFANSVNTESVIYTPQTASPFRRNVLIASGVTVDVRWFELAGVVRSFTMDGSESPVDITPIGAEGQIQLAGLNAWTATLSVVASDDVIQHFSQPASGLLHVVRAGSTERTLTVAVSYGGAFPTHEDTGLETVELVLYNAALHRPFWQ